MVPVEMGQRPVLQKPQKLYRTEKPFLVNRYLKTERCIRLKPPVRNEPFVYIRISGQNSSAIITFQTFAAAFRVRKLFGTVDEYR